MSFGIIGALAGSLAAVLAFKFWASPRSRQQRLGHIGTIIGLATVPPMIGSLVDTELQKQADVISEQRATLREQSAREEMRRGFQRVEQDMSAAVRQLLEAYRLPAGPARVRAVQSALLNYDRATSRLGRNARTNVASLLPLASDTLAAAPIPREVQPPSRAVPREAAPDVTSSAATTPALISGAETASPTVVPTPIFIPPPPPVIMIPPAVMTTPPL
jgi:hypothetical protein